MVDSPNLKYPDCSFHLRSFCVPGSTLITNTPNFANYSLGPLAGSGCDTINSVNNISTGLNIVVYPNPATDFIAVDYGNIKWTGGNVDLEILNGLSQTVYMRQLPQYSAIQKIDISNLPQGYYVVRLKRNGEMVAGRSFVKE